MNNKYNKKFILDKNQKIIYLNNIFIKKSKK